MARDQKLTLILSSNIITLLFILTCAVFSGVSFQHYQFPNNVRRKEKKRSKTSELNNE